MCRGQSISSCCSSSSSPWLCLSQSPGFFSSKATATHLHELAKAAKLYLWVRTLCKTKREDFHCSCAGLLVAPRVANQGALTHGWSRWCPEMNPLQSEGKQLADKLTRLGVANQSMPHTGTAHEFFGTHDVLPKAKEVQNLAASRLKEALRQLKARRRRAKGGYMALTGL